MLEITKRTERIDRSPRSEHTLAIWLFVSLSLIPGGALGLFPDRWYQLPHGVQWAGYLMSLILLTVACSLIVNPGDEQSSGSGHDLAELRKRRRKSASLPDAFRGWLTAVDR
jgi:hypothetical protein